MSYLEWVNQDVKRSYRYRAILDKIANCERDIEKDRERITALQNGAPRTWGIEKPSGFGFGLTDASFWRAARSGAAKYIANQFPGYSYTPPEPTEQELQEEKRREEQRRLQKEQEDDAIFRPKEIEYHQGNIKTLQGFIDEWRNNLSDLERTPLRSWLTMSAEQRVEELDIRINDTRLTRVIYKFFHFDHDNLTGDLMDILDTWETAGMRTTIRITRGFVCTMSYRQVPITVTRRSYEIDDCLVRTMLTFTDLAWEHIMPEPDTVVT